MMATFSLLFSGALTHHFAGRWVEASRIYREILAAEPEHPKSLYLMALLATNAGNSPLAARLFQQATQLKNLDSLANLANELVNRNEFELAETLHRQIADAAPDSPAVWNNLGNFFRVTSKPDQACEAFERAIWVDPHFVPAHCNLGNALKDRGQIREAIAAFRRAVELDPTDPQIHSNLVYACGFSPDYNAASLLAEATAWADRFETPLLEQHPAHHKDQNTTHRLKIGYVSMDFRNHVVGRNVLPILEHHDRQRFEVHCFSTLANADAMTPIFQQAADRWHECGSLDDAALAEKIRDEGIDILVDLSLHMAGNRLLTFARKPARLQITWAGYPGTTGLRSIDYRITDPHLDPPGETDTNYSEKSLRLPNTYWCHRPIDSTPEVNPLPAIATGFVTFGCLNSFAKVNDESLALWAAVLNQAPGSRLLLLCPEGWARAHTLDFFQSRSILKSRVEFVGLTRPEEHMQRYSRIDICLDPLPYPGHTTTLDSLWMGVPVATLAGVTSLSRGSVTALSHVGLHRLITSSAKDYVSAAVKLAGDLPRLSRLRMELRQRLAASAICDEAGFARNLEHAYQTAWSSRP